MPQASVPLRLVLCVVHACVGHFSVLARVSKVEGFRTSGFVLKVGLGLLSLESGALLGRGMVVQRYQTSHLPCTRVKFFLIKGIWRLNC